MTGLYFLFPTLFTIFISFLVVRAGAIALMMTGMKKDRAVFQALSAFSGTGFTTREAERVVNHPARRKIISWLMIFGNAGIVTVIITATSSMVTSGGARLPLNAAILVIGIIIIYKIASSKGFIQRWERYIEKKLIHLPAFDEAPVEDLLHLIEGYGLVRATIKSDSPLIGKTVGDFLSDCKICREDITVLGIERDKEWLPIPKLDEHITDGDMLIAYGRLDALKGFFTDDSWSKEKVQ